MPYPLCYHFPDLFLSKLAFLALSLRLLVPCVHFLLPPPRFFDMASMVSPPRQATFFGLHHHLLGIRASRWCAWFEECTVASAKAQELTEDLGSVEAFVVDLITAEEVEDMAGPRRTWDF